MTEAGIIAGCGAAEKGEVKETTAFQKAYEAGKSLA